MYSSMYEGENGGNNYSYHNYSFFFFFFAQTFPFSSAG